MPPWSLPIGDRACRAGSGPRGQIAVPSCRLAALTSPGSVPTIESASHEEAHVNSKDFEIPLSELRHGCDPAELPFATTAELTARDEVIGQARAVSAIDFGLAIRNHGYNIFVSGIPGTGRNSIVKSIVKRISRDRPVPDDWCYINNFKDTD